MERMVRMKKSTGSIVIIAIIAIIIIGFVGSYNGMVSKAEEVDNKFATIDAQLQRRADLIPNLVNTVKGYAAQEKEIIDSVTEARAKLTGASTVEEKANADEDTRKFHQPAWRHGGRRDNHPHRRRGRHGDRHRGGRAVV